MTKKIIILACFFSINFGFSQKKWTLKECVNHALESNISVQQNKLNVQLASLDVKDAKGNFLPNLFGSSTAGLGFGLVVINGQRVQTDNFNSSIGLNSNTTLFNGFVNLNTYKQAKLGVESSKLDLERIQNDVSLLVVNAYLNILFAKENLTVAKVQYEISNTQIEAAKNRFESGAIAKGDLLNTESTAATNLQNLIAQQNALDLATLNLAQLLQVSSDGFDIVTIEADVFSNTLLYENSGIVYNKALTTQPQIDNAKLSVENADLAIEVAKGALMPTLSFNARANTNYVSRFDTETFGSNANFLNQLEDELGYSFVLSLSIPIFNRFQTRNNIDRSFINRETSLLNLENEKLQLQQTIEQAFLDVKSALKSYEAAQISLVAQQEAFKNAQERFNFGAMTLFDFDQIRNRFVNAESTLIRAKYDYAFKTKVLQFYYGELNFDE